MSRMVGVGPFEVLKESFTSKWKLENCRRSSDVHVTIRRSTKEKEIHMERKENYVKDIFLATDANCDDYEAGKGAFSCVLPIYRVRLTFQSDNTESVTKLYNYLFVDEIQVPSKKNIIIPMPNSTGSCPVRSEALSCSSPELNQSRPQGFPRPVFGVRGSNAAFCNQQKQPRNFRSGLTPPEKRTNLRRSPYNNGQQIHFTSQEQENASSSSLNLLSARSEVDRNCVKNLSSLLEEVTEQNVDDHENPKLTSEQSAILSAVQAGDNIFFTGGAGTGKSTLLRKIIEITRSNFGNENVFVTATTGLAACALQGTTLHQLFGIPAVSEDSSPLVWDTWIQKTVDKRYIAQRLRAARVIIIDEISMLGPSMFEFIDKCLRRVRCQDSKLMGGVQLICCGDFFQLPPVQIVSTYNTSSKSNHHSNYSTRNNDDDNSNLRGNMDKCCDLVNLSQSSQSMVDVGAVQTNRRFCFQSNIWNQVFPANSNCYILSTIYRQLEDPEFAELLEDIRVGRCSAESLQQLNDRCHQQSLTSFHGVHATQILTHKKDVDTINAQKLVELSGEKFVYTAQDSGDTNFLAMLQKHCPAKSTLELKVGAQVVLMKTTQPSQGLVNGARGIVVRILRETRWPVVKFAHNGREYPITYETFPLTMSGRIIAQRTQLPLDLAWAISVHRAQGMTIDQGEVNVRHAFEFGQIYVALSRVRSRAGLSLKSMIQTNQIKVDVHVQEFYRQLRVAQECKRIDNRSENSKKQQSRQKGDKFDRIRRNTAVIEL